jgi:hypothetical protein
MRLITIVLSLFLLTTTSYSFCKEYNLLSDSLKKHSAKKHLSKKEIIKLMAEEERNWKPYFDNCVFVNEYSVKQRLMAYPYSKAVKVLAVSYPCFCDNVDAGIIIDSPGRSIDTLPKKVNDTLLKTGLNVKNGVLNYSSIKEVKVLTQSQINQLTNTIYNTDFKVRGHFEIPILFEQGGGGCFDPRNALLFVDKNGKIFDYIEICFECHVADSKSRKITLGPGCDQKFELLRQYFISLGIKYGTINKN